MIGRCRVCQRTCLEEDGPVLYEGYVYHANCFNLWIERRTKSLKARFDKAGLRRSEIDELKELKKLKAGIVV